MSTTLVLILIPAFALLVTAVLTPLVRSSALAVGVVASVRPDRWHSKATPVVGGVAIFVGFGGAVILGDLLSPELSSGLRAQGDGVFALSHWEALMSAGTLLFLVGLVDDLVQLKPVTKLVGQLAAAAILVGSGVGFWLTGSYVVDVGISLLWFVGMTNALNLLDNMDGLAGGVGAIAGAVFAVLFLMDGDMGLAGLALALTGAMLGFLAHNYPPARIFMGDSGSLFLGIFLAGLALAPTPGLSRGLFAVVAVPVLILSVPILDTTFVTVSRLLEGRSPAEGGKDHTSHGLVAIGVSEERAMTILWALALSGGLVALMLRTTGRALAGVLGGLLLISLALLGSYLLSARFQRRIGDEGESDAEAGASVLYERVLTFHQRLPILAFAMDVVLVGLAYYASYLIRWEPGALGAEFDFLRLTLPVVVTAKLVAFAWAGVYSARWRHFGMEDALGLFRANLFASILTAAVLLLLQRIGVSRGVLFIDFFVCSALTLGARFSFRIMEGVGRRLSREGVPVVLVGRPADADLAMREVPRLENAEFRPVAVADAAYGPPRGRFRGLPLFGSSSALERAIRETAAHTVVVIRRAGEEDWRLPYTVRDHLKDLGALDIFVLEVGLRRWSADRHGTGDRLDVVEWHDGVKGGWV